MAEFLTMQEAEDKFGKKGKTNADNCCCKSEKQLLVAAGDLQRP